MNYSLDDNHLNLVFEENLISTTVKSLLSESKELISQSNLAERVLVDLSRVELIDSQGLNFLISLYQKSHEMKKEFQVTGASPTNERLFSFVNLKERFGILGD